MDKYVEDTKERHKRREYECVLGTQMAMNKTENWKAKEWYFKIEKWGCLRKRIIKDNVWDFKLKVNLVILIIYWV